MNKILIKLFLLVFSLNILADNKIDSLYIALSGSEDYFEKIEVLHEIGKFYLKKMPDSAMYYAEKMETLSENNDDSLNIGYSYKLKGDAGIYSGSLKLAEQNYLKAITVFKSINKIEQISKIKNNLGAVYQFSGQYEKAIKLYKESLQNSIGVVDTLSISKSYNNIGSLYIKMGDSEKALVYLEKSLVYKKQLHDLIGISKTLLNIGNVFLKEKNNLKAIEYYEAALKIKIEMGDSLSISTSLSNIGLSYKNMSNYNNAVKYYLQALDIARNTGYKKQEALICNNIASTYDDWSELDSSNTFYKEKVVEYYSKAVNVCEEIGDNEGVINVVNNLGAFYSQEKEYDKAMAYFLRCLKYIKKYDYLSKEVIVYVNIADIYIQKKDYTEAILYLNKVINILNTHPDDIGFVNAYNKLSEVYFKMKKYEVAKQYAYKSLYIIEKTNDIFRKKVLFDRLSVIFEKTGDFKRAYFYHKKYTSLKDSIFNNDSKNTIIQLQTMYKAKEQKQEIKLLNTKYRLNSIKLKAEKLKLRQQRIMSIGLIVIIVLVLVFLYLLYKQIKAKNLANKLLFDKNEEINIQKNEIELQFKLIKKQNTEITDSINYARLIQNAILPDINILNDSFKDYFVLFEPKSIVSGDFYWITKYNNKIIVAAVDCTGHGVPGAFMSMLGVSFLNEIVLNNNNLNSADILNLLREKVILSLKQVSIESNQKDGMDMSLSIIDTDNKTIDFAGAYNPLFIVTSINSEIEQQISFDSKKIENEKFKLLELKADRMPISISRKTESFKSNILKYSENDKIFMFSDGIVDQFHFKTLKKYKKAKFKKNIIETSNMTASKQGEIIKASYLEWKGNSEQTDDVLIIGIDL